MMPHAKKSAPVHQEIVLFVFPNDLVNLSQWQHGEKLQKTLNVSILAQGPLWSRLEGINFNRLSCLPGHCGSIDKIRSGKFGLGEATLAHSQNSYPLSHPWT